MKPACKNLRTKKMYIPAVAQESLEVGADNQQSAHSSHCWCNRTLSEAGPDDRAVGAQVCTSTRSCFEE
jgi:hypothetical protein